MTETTISRNGVVKCRCGEGTVVDLDSRTTVVTCGHCGETTHHSLPVATVDGIFGLFGIGISEDQFGQLVVTHEGEMSEQVQNWMFCHQADLRQQFREARQQNMCQYVGGSLSGQPHRHRWVRDDVVVRIGPGHWERYGHKSDDDRLWFLGRSRSRRLAIARRYVEDAG